MSLPFRRRMPVHGRAFLTTGANGAGPNAEFPSTRRLDVGCFERDRVISAHRDHLFTQRQTEI